MRVFVLICGLAALLTIIVGLFLYSMMARKLETAQQAYQALGHVDSLYISNAERPRWDAKVVKTS